MRTGGVEVCWTEWRGCTQAATYNSWSNTAHTSHVPLLHGSWCAPRYKMCGGMFEIVKEGSRMLQIVLTRSRLFGGKTFRDPKPPNPNIIICSAMYAPHHFWRIQIEKSAVFSNVDEAGISVMFPWSAWAPYHSHNSILHEYFDSFWVGVNFERVNLFDAQLISLKMF